MVGRRKVFVIEARRSALVRERTVMFYDRVTANAGIGRLGCAHLTGCYASVSAGRQQLIGREIYVQLNPESDFRY